MVMRRLEKKYAKLYYMHSSKKAYGLQKWKLLQYLDLNRILNYA